MKKASLVIVLALAAPLFGQSLDNLMSKYRIEWSDAALAAGLGRDLGYDPSRVLYFKDRFGDENSDDLITSLYLASRGKTDIGEIYKLRNSGLSWGRIATQLGVRPGNLGDDRNLWSKARDTDIAEAIWMDRLNKGFGLSNDDIKWARSQGLSWEDIYLAKQYALDRKRDFRGSVRDYSNKAKWDYVRKRGMRAGGAYDPRFDDRSKARKRSIWNAMRREKLQEELKKRKGG